MSNITTVYFSAGKKYTAPLQLFPLNCPVPVMVKAGLIMGDRSYPGSVAQGFVRSHPGSVAQGLLLHFKN